MNLRIGLSFWLAFLFSVTLLVTDQREIFASSSGHFRKVVIIVLENTDYSEALNQPFLSQLVSRGALLSNYYAVTHPSQPNYIALISGSTHGVVDDGPVVL